MSISRSMKRTPRGKSRIRLPGFRYDGATLTAYISLIKPGSGGRVRVRKVVHDVTIDKAHEEWKKLRDELHSGRPRPGTVTLNDYVERQWSNIVLRVSPRTRRGYETHLKHLVLPELGPLPLEKINAAVARDYAGRLKAGTAKVAKGEPKAGGYSANTINGCLAILRRILRDAVDREEILYYPIRGRLPKEKPVLLKQELSPAEWEALVRAFDDEAGFRRVIAERPDLREPVTSAHYSVARKFGGGRPADGPETGMHFQRFRSWKPFVVVALETGLRLGDLNDLRWSSVDLAGGWIRRVMSKTREEAVIPISPACKEALNEMRFRRKDTEDGTEYVFPGTPGEQEEGGPEVRRPASSTMLYRYFTIAKASAGIKRPLRFHDLRHSFASRLASAGVSLQCIAKMLGHTTVVMSQRYARPDETALRSALQAVAETAAARAGKPAQGASDIAK